MNYFKYFNLIVIAVFLTACNSSGMIRLYDGVEKDSSEIATFVFPKSLDLQEVDGTKVRSMMFSSNDTYQLQLLPGKHFIKTAYSEYWGTEKLGNMEDSDSFYFAIDAQAGNQYQFEHNGPTDLKNALKTNSTSNIKIWAIDRASGSKINPTTNQSYGGFLSGLLNNESETKSQPVPISNPVDADPAIRQTVESQLKYWWNLADIKQRENFRKWLATQ